MKVNLLKKTLYDVYHNRRPKVGMFVAFEGSLCEKISVAGEKVALMFHAAGDKTEPFLAGFLVCILPSV